MARIAFLGLSLTVPPCIDGWGLLREADVLSLRLAGKSVGCARTRPRRTLISRVGRVYSTRIVEIFVKVRVIANAISHVKWQSREEESKTA
jgi:hypothetical protein